MRSGQPLGLRRYRRAILVVGVAMVIGLWWLFRPERLFINQQVNEVAPAEIASAQPLFIGSLHPVADGSQTTGTVSILKNGAQLQLKVSNLQSNSAQAFMVELGSAAESTQQAIVLGDITIGGNQTLNIPSGFDPVVHKTVLLADQSHNVIAKATLERF
jgi:hypothetical protein